MKKIIRLAAIAIFPITLFTTATPSEALFRSRNRNHFRTCATELKQAGISPEKASEACANAVRPKDLSRCVIEIDGSTELKSDDIIEACFRARQPIDLGSCVVGINEDVTNITDNLAVLDHCRRSLLPKRFSDCVVGINNELAISLETALGTCIKAEDFPRALN
jgi:hypothetical protein